MLGKCCYMPTYRYFHSLKRKGYFKVDIFLLSHRSLSQCALVMRSAPVFFFFFFLIFLLFGSHLWMTFFSSPTISDYVFSRKNIIFPIYAWKKNDWIDLCERKRKEEGKQASRKKRRERKKTEKRMKEGREGEGIGEQRKEVIFLLLFYWNVRGMFRMNLKKFQRA